ncbi:hypothetical protein DY000_02046562 [Brassica cretica]|uniref:F-box associated beta-propeller type 3 domain-containing protein n=1 Tax=Brassica cretica TaxID=69181 RepID=A0ABQ7F609_BRACR|nr:hypothetical protein DY000_02046562 [Brassica cretica]
MKFPPDDMWIFRRDNEQFACGYASGLIYFYGMWTDKNEVPVICNPNTGRYETLPYISRYRRSYSLFGFDPVEKQYKVLHMAYPCCPNDHRVMTLGTTGMREKSSFAIACFDIRSEKFKILYPESFCELTNYNGKLGVIYYDDLTHDAVELRVWVLEDVDKQEWSKYSYTLRGDKLFPHYASVVGVISTGEIVLSMADYTSTQPFYIFYYNPEKNTN